LIDFEVDRYELDRLLSKNWDPAGDSTTGAWEPAPAETTFDLVNHYKLPEPNDSSFVFVGGSGYAVDDTILILGSQVGGVNVTNNITITNNITNNITQIMNCSSDPNCVLTDGSRNISYLNVTENISAKHISANNICYSNGTNCMATTPTLNNITGSGVPFIISATGSTRCIRFEATSVFIGSGSNCYA
jgi:hypothetical protein